MYNWQQKDWPKFNYQLESIEPLLAISSEKIGYLKGLLASLSTIDKQQTLIDAMVFEALTTSAIEGEFLS